MIGTYDHYSCDACLYDTVGLARQIVAADPGKKAFKLWLVSVRVGLATPAGLGYAALETLAIVVVRTDQEGSDPNVALTIKSDRDYAVGQAWKQEAELVRRTGKGPVYWTADEMRELLDTGKVSGYEGHHINSVKGNEENRALIRNPRNIEFKKGRAGHIEAHGGASETPPRGG